MSRLHVLASGASANSGFSVKIYSPKRWIEYQSSLAHSLMRPFSIVDVTPEMKLKVLRVVALPKTPDRLDARGFSVASSVARIVLMDKAKAITVQPIKEERVARNC